MKSFSISSSIAVIALFAVAASSSFGGKNAVSATAFGKLPSMHVTPKTVRIRSSRIPETPKKPGTGSRNYRDNSNSPSQPRTPNQLFGNKNSNKGSSPPGAPTKMAGGSRQNSESPFSTPSKSSRSSPPPSTPQNQVQRGIPQQPGTPTKANGFF